MDSKKSRYLYCLLYTIFNIIIEFAIFSVIRTSLDKLDFLLWFAFVSLFTLLYFLIFKSHMAFFMYPYFLLAVIYISHVLVKLIRVIKHNLDVTSAIFAVNIEFFAPLLVIILLNALSLILTKITHFLIVRKKK